MSYNNGYLNGIKSYADDALSVANQILEISQQALDEASSITDEKAILATVQDGLIGCLDDIIELAKGL